jgi:hypothetical protein
VPIAKIEVVVLSQRSRRKNQQSDKKANCKREELGKLTPAHSWLRHMGDHVGDWRP